MARRFYNEATIRMLRELLEAGAQEFSDTTALNNQWMYRRWDGGGVSYTAGERLRYGDELYTVLQDHTSQNNWNPAAAPSLFAKVLIPDDDVIYEWEQPDSTNPYSAGDMVLHNGKVWQSNIDGNVWEPGAVGVNTWDEVTPE